MQWEIVVSVILVIGICAAIMEARQKRAARKKEAKDIRTEQHYANEASKKQDK
jgi:hypothetical protein